MLHLLLQLVAYKMLSVTATNSGGNQQTLRLVYFIYYLMESYYDLMSARVLPVLRGIQTQISSNAIRGRLAI